MRYHPSVRELVPQKAEGKVNDYLYVNYQDGISVVTRLLLFYN